MKCPKCGTFQLRVIDSRDKDHGTKIRRRRECTRCSHRFTTVESAGEYYEPLSAEGLIKNFNWDQLVEEIKSSMLKRCAKHKEDPNMDEIYKQLGLE